MARNVPRASRCPHCNAPFTPQVSRTHYTCGYCGHAFDLEGPPSIPPAPPAPASAPTNPQVAMIIAGSVGVLLLGVIVAVFAWRGDPPEEVPPSRPEPVSSPPPAVVPPPPFVPSPPPPPRPERLQWAERDAPVFVDLNGDGTDEIIGHVSRYNSGSTDLVAAFDGKTFEKLWETLPSEGPDASSTTKVIAQGGRLVMSEQRAVNLLELETGKRLGRVALSDSPRRLCIPPGDTESVWVEVVDRKHLLFNTRTATARPAPRAPPGCATPPLSPQTCNMLRPAEHPTPCIRSSYPPSDIRGFSTQYLYRANGYTLALGSRWPGTQVPLVAVYEPGNRKPLWHGVVADGDPLLLRDTPPKTADITRDAVYILYEMEQGGARLIRRDLRTGAIAWDVAVPRTNMGTSPSVIWIQGERIYVPHWQSLEVFDAATGNLVGTLGPE
ncbi:Rcat domain-containing protein [Corallococcus silvisoli]|uniref:hypothetical protein n=1 Tax=Corallococcus silvisoli TaxID=2697031 RepID=UPI0013777DDF|nr:hypothetical protein [Corallococcus silvisoli]NBD12310.1 hypothetical protein [Corallococcus silvisoli]